MDRAVLDAYGWTDIPTDCEFLLDYEIDEATWGRKKKPYRYRWPDPIRDEVLARLLALNAERARRGKPHSGVTSPTSPQATTPSPVGNDTVKRKYLDPPSRSQSPNPSGPPTMTDTTIQAPDSRAHVGNHPTSLPLQAEGHEEHAYVMARKTTPKQIAMWCVQSSSMPDKGIRPSIEVIT